LSRREKVFEKRRSSFFGDVDLILQVAAVSRLCVLDLPTQVFNLRLQLSLLVFELKKRKESRYCLSSKEEEQHQR
jgi:hypothetical protein